MAEIRAQIQKIYTLVITEREALWLKALMQNPLSNDPDPNNENEENAEMRKAFWNALELEKD